MRQIRILFIVTVFTVMNLFMATQWSWAEDLDLSDRLGVGYMRPFTMDLSSMAVRYYPQKDVGVTVALGVDTRKKASKFAFLGKAHKVLFTEANMNFYTGGGLGIISRESLSGKSNDSGFELTGFVGGEFFLDGLESLGLIFETGVGVTSISSQVQFRTFGYSPIQAGFIFYF